MPVTHGYTTLPRLKDELRVTDTDADGMLERCIEAASRWIDDATGRRFHAGTGTRVYTPEWQDLLLIDDCLAVTALATDADGDRVYETVWAATDYDLEPATAPARGRPFTAVRATPRGRHRFPRLPRAAQVTGTFGYTAAVPGQAAFPPAIERACLLVAARLFKRVDAPFGVLGALEVGGTVRLPRMEEDPDVRALLRGYVYDTVRVAG